MAAWSPAAAETETARVGVPWLLQVGSSRSALTVPGLDYDCRAEVISPGSAASEVVDGFGNSVGVESGLRSVGVTRFRWLWTAAEIIGSSSRVGQFAS